MNPKYVVFWAFIPVWTFLAPITQGQKQDLRRTPIVEAFEKNKDAVVNISSKYVLRRSNDIFSLWDDFPFFQTRPQTFTLSSLGSGFVLDQRGYIVTNAHVVEQANEITVIFADGTEHIAQKIAADPAIDLAVLKIDTDTALPTVTLGHSDDLMIGETVLAVGNPFGYQHTLTNGIVSAIHRDVDLGQEKKLGHLIQISAPINPGNSGGPLLNIYGELIGINTAIRKAAQGIGFAIPVDQLQQSLPALLDIEKLRRMDFGVKVGPLEEGQLTAKHIAAADGLLVRSVRVESTAAQADLQAGDIITAVNGQSIKSAIDFQLNLLEQPPDTPLQLEIWRTGHQSDSAQKQNITLVLQQKPQPDAPALAQRMFGLKIAPLTEPMIRRYNLLGQPGSVVVLSVDDPSAAQQAGILPGDLIVALGDKEIPNLEQLGLELELLPPGSVAQITLQGVRTSGWGFRERIQYNCNLPVQDLQPPTAPANRSLEL